MFNFEIVDCPLKCGKLGKRNRDECYIVKCDECDTLWMWKAKSKKPLPITKQKEAPKCGCGRCGR
jgi:hypothetical protein